MSQPSLLIQDANGVKQTVFTHNPNGQTNAFNSQPVVLASDDPLVSKVATETTLAGLSAKIPAKGSTTKSGSLPVTLATDDPLLAKVATEATLNGILDKIPAQGPASRVNSLPVTLSSDDLLVAKVATEATLVSISAKTPALGSAVKAGSVPVTLASDHGSISVSSTGGLGSMALVPSGTVNGTAIGNLPQGAVGLRMYLGINDTVTFTISSSAPSSAPARVFTIGGSLTGPNWDENLSGGQMMYVTSVTGSPQFRWV